MSIFKSKPSNDRKTGSGSKLFIQLKDGESITGVCRGEIAEEYQIYENGKYRPAAKGEEGARWKFKTNFIVNENGVLLPKILSGGKQIADGLEEIGLEYEIQKTLVKITRKGSNLETNYSVIVPKGGELTPDQISKIADIRLNSLSKTEDQPDKGAFPFD